MYILITWCDCGSEQDPWSQVVWTLARLVSMLKCLLYPRTQHFIDAVSAETHTRTDTHTQIHRTLRMWFSLKQGWATLMIERATKMLSSLPEGQIVTMHIHQQDTVTPSFYQPITATKWMKTTKYILVIKVYFTNISIFHSQTHLVMFLFRIGFVYREQRGIDSIMCHRVAPKLTSGVYTLHSTRLADSLGPILFLVASSACVAGMAGKTRQDRSC